MKIFILCMLFALVTPSVAFADTTLLWLVNKESPLPPDYTPPHLTVQNGVTANKYALEAFAKMEQDIKSAGITNLKLQSAYRPYQHQENIFNKKVNSLGPDHHSLEAARITAAQTVQPPGASEHQTGLALDVTTDGSLTENFATTPAGEWLQNNCHHYGFIIRYPKDKTQTTQIIYEPWHLRYVGHPHASIMYNLNLTLEEYHQYMREIEHYLFWCKEGLGDYYLVSYYTTPVGDGEVSATCINGVGYIVSIKKSSG